MTRVLLALTATALGLLALLGFKSEARPVAAGPLPAASLPGAGAGAGAATASAGSPPPGTTGSSATSTPAAAGKRYTGSAVQTQYGVVQVAVVVSGHSIRSVSFLRLEAFDGHSQQINSYAAPILLKETLSAQSARIDTVSGASYTSDGYRQSLQSALDQAGLR